MGAERYKDGPARLFTDNEDTITVPCRYCKKPCAMRTVFAEAISAWNLKERGRQDPIMRGDVMVCEACDPRWRHEVAEIDRQRALAVKTVCDDIERGRPAHVKDWMNGYGWARDAIRAARKARAEGTTGKDALG